MNMTITTSNMTMEEKFRTWRRSDDVKDLRTIADDVEAESDNQRLGFCAYTVANNIRAIAERLENNYVG